MTEPSDPATLRSGKCKVCGAVKRRHCDLDEPGVDHNGDCPLMHHEFVSRQDDGQSSPATLRALADDLERPTKLWEPDAVHAQAATALREAAASLETARIHSDVDSTVTFLLGQRVDAAEALCATLERKNEQNNAIVVAIARLCDGEEPSEFMLSFGIVRAVEDLRASRDEAQRQVEELKRVTL